jgi:hypothetical protein
MTLEQGAELGGFVEAAGRSLETSQRQLLGEERPAGETAMALAEVELEVKATLDHSGAEMRLLPIARREAAAGAVAAETISTLRLRYVAVPWE